MPRLSSSPATDCSNSFRRDPPPPTPSTWRELMSFGHSEMMDALAETPRECGNAWTADCLAAWSTPHKCSQRTNGLEHMNEMNSSDCAESEATLGSIVSKSNSACCQTRFNSTNTSCVESVAVFAGSCSTRNVKYTYTAQTAQTEETKKHLAQTAPSGNASSLAFKPLRPSLRGVLDSPQNCSLRTARSPKFHTTADIPPRTPRQPLQTMHLNVDPTRPPDPVPHPIDARDGTATLGVEQLATARAGRARCSSAPYGFGDGFERTAAPEDVGEPAWLRATAGNSAPVGQTLVAPPRG
ncbi:hypothetical protein BDK51DRAFT_48130 [Blyttiomyces helicus]|uniref:Uncharacterized protein n=1 Tax=Blyttiomyces helicus TaxID=388810 RepID=A0A4P9VZU6_9FUNG|nr:hypothetical protein BDK51DRAFT_48130 [Blyttiomyces helicus]|eukprot:RKO85314.1 hypothetical protein BDK51DRAFT_48130 [Blyttiomyces helicus]